MGLLRVTWTHSKHQYEAYEDHGILGRLPNRVLSPDAA